SQLGRRTRSGASDARLIERAFEPGESADDAELPSDVLEDRERSVQLRLGVRGGDDRPEPRASLRDGREADPLREQASREELVRETHGEIRLADDDGRDRGLADPRVEAEPREAFLEALRVGPEPL